MTKPICFLSDFGLTEDFVGTCKGVILSIAPEAKVIDLTHEVPGFGVRAGAETLQHAARYMPDETVYLAVVDPGVGTERLALALRARSGASLVGPDNGLLLPAAESLGGVSEAVLLNDGRYHVHPVSGTFHGRDIFASTAAHLAAGVELSNLGESIEPGSLERVEMPGPERDREGLIVHILSIDRYGNARLSVMQEETDLEYGMELTVEARDGKVPVRYLETFGAAHTGELTLVPDSHWRLSLAINRGNASRALGLNTGDRVRLSKP